MYVIRKYFFQIQAIKRLEQKRVTCIRGAMETQRLSRLTQLTLLVTSYESLSQGQRAEVATSLQNIVKDFPADQHRIDKVTSAWVEDSSDTQPDDLWGYAETHSAPSSLTIPTEPADSEPPPTQTMADQAEGSLVHSSTPVSSMLATLYSSFLASVQQMGTLLSPRTVLPRPGEQDDETKVTQELSQAQRRLVMEEESIWKQLSEVARGEETEGGVSFLARELEDKSTKIVTSYERRNNPPTRKVYTQCRTILRAMGVPCIDTKGGVEGEALAAAIVQDGLADYVASEDTVSFSSSSWGCF